MRNLRDIADNQEIINLLEIYCQSYDYTSKSRLKTLHFGSTRYTHLLDSEADSAE